MNLTLSACPFCAAIVKGDGASLGLYIVLMSVEGSARINSAASMWPFTRAAQRGVVPGRVCLVVFIACGGYLSKYFVVESNFSRFV